MAPNDISIDEKTAGLPTNVGWGKGAESNVLYLTAGQSLYRLKTNATGYHLPAK